MRLTLSDEQRALRAGLRDYLRKAWPGERVRAAITTPFDHAVWQDLTDMGVFDLGDGGHRGEGGLTLTDAAVMFEELGRALVPGPLVATALCSATAPAGAVVTVLDLTQRPIVEHLEVASHVVVLGDGPTLVDAATITADPLDPLDPLTPVSLVRETPPARGADDSGAFRARGTLLSAALAVGVAQGALDLATTYATQRVQFDRVIGSFQAVKHLLADALARTELARATVWAAAATLPCDGRCPPTIAEHRTLASAAVLAHDAAATNGRTCVQVHGGMGFTWEALPHLYLKRAWVLQTAYGTRDQHLEAVAFGLAHEMA